jgi:hypothetical protein
MKVYLCGGGLGTEHYLWNIGHIKILAFSSKIAILSTWIYYESNKSDTKVFSESKSGIDVIGYNLVFKKW